MRRWFFGLLAVIVTLCGLGFPVATGIAADRTAALASVQPADTVSGFDMTQIPDVVEAVGRSFDNADRSSDIGHLEFAVFAFRDPEAASSALPDVLRALSPVLRQDAQRIASPPLGDESAAWTAVTGDFSVAIVLVRDGQYIDAMYGVAKDSAPLDALVSTAKEIIGRSPLATPGATPPDPDSATAIADQQRPLTSGGLWDLLPVYEDLPGDFVLYTEESWQP